MITTPLDRRDNLILAPLTMKEKRSRRARKGNALHVLVTKSKKKSFLDEIGDVLMDELYATSHHNGVCVIDHLRSSFEAPPATSSCPSSASCSSTRTLAERVSNSVTSMDSHNSLQVIHSETRTQISFSKSNKGFSITKKEHYTDKANVFSLDDLNVLTDIERLAAHYGQVAHMGILDRSYRFFMNKSRTAGLCFKIETGVTVVVGDPLCDTDMIAELLSEFRTYRRQHHWGIAFMGASESFLRDYAKPNGWTAIRFATERVLNPQTNDVLLEISGKRITTQNRHLLNLNKGGITLGIYAPAIHGTNTQLQADLVAVYDAWRADRNSAVSPQAFITVYDPFALPGLMTYVYTYYADGTINGFAALRRLGSGGYHIDPCVAAPGSAKGISDLLLVAAMAMLHYAGVSYLGFGFEPMYALTREDIVGMPFPFGYLTRQIYRHAFHRLPIGGKKAYHMKFRPDPIQDSGLYLVFPSSIPGPRHLLAMTHMANISLRKMFLADLRRWVSCERLKAKIDVLPTDEKVDSTKPKANLAGHPNAK
ncbi:Lysylphosphatidylglycerol synthetase, domain of unknown function DUF2156 [Penicillium expansum]|uniref:Phosphatidylglycerol lysyltransferase C-terminal domain-containing protein n=1 Tax=Penicillium expansum TaxID=27334 RepID=A0A0A2JPM5_PENEN|nr:Lysylphosphatidylglycerol synthetase, domain of unknown function DUF2156 [Penicillium expansum]KGO44538.1 Lysylphosphatidylglycerol synthetase, domain of unknown function DUF2156 [Penicillium expansum]KGO53628.1 Lysylphosphatidylglycerol synthetase, domain of unknown function DUF2156 [Penicillium expansum]KGO56786.1 Lysylphosphatidylglycerol synthetase, domain of unknown function DUF2156 [Penicillium expansum]